MIIDFNRLRTFTTVAHIGSITKAALSLHLTQQAVSSQIQLLEQDLGLLLFKRANRRIYLTKEGLKLYKQVSPHFKIMESHIIDLVGEVATMDTTLVVGASNEVAEMLLCERIVEFKKQYPQIQFELILSSDTKTEEGILNGQLDLGFVVFSKDVKLLNLTSFRREDFITVASHEYLKQHPPIKKIKDLLSHSIIDFEPHCPSLKTWVMKNDKKLLSHFSHTQAVISANDDRMIRRLVLNHMGVANLPRSLVQDELQSGKLVEVLKSSKKIQAGIDIITMKRKTHGLAAKTFMEFMLT